MRAYLQSEFGGCLYNPSMHEPAAKICISVPFSAVGVFRDACTASELWLGKILHAPNLRLLALWSTQYTVYRNNDLFQPER